MSQKRVSACILKSLPGTSNLWKSCRRWIAANVLQPLDTLMGLNAKLVSEAASKGVAPSAPGLGGGFGGGVSPFGGSSLFGPKPVTTAPGTAVPASGQAMSVAQWLQHPHQDLTAQVRFSPKPWYQQLQCEHILG